MLKKQPKKKPLLKPKEEEFVDAYVENDFNGTKAAREVYGDEAASEEAIRARSSYLLTKSHITEAIEVKRETLKEALIARGITPAKIAEKVEVLLDAKQPIYKNNNKTGEIEHVGDNTDFNAVDKGLKHATTIFGVIDPEKPRAPNVYNFFFDPKLQADVKELENRIKAKMIKPDA